MCKTAGERSIIKDWMPSTKSALPQLLFIEGWNDAHVCLRWNSHPQLSELYLINRRAALLLGTKNGEH